MFPVCPPQFWGKPSGGPRSHTVGKLRHRQPLGVPTGMDIWPSNWCPEPGVNSVGPGGQAPQRPACMIPSGEEGAGQPGQCPPLLPHPHQQPPLRGQHVSGVMTMGHSPRGLPGCRGRGDCWPPHSWQLSPAALVQARAGVPALWAGGWPLGLALPPSGMCFGGSLAIPLSTSSGRHPPPRPYCAPQVLGCQAGFLCSSRL